MQCATMKYEIMLLESVEVYFTYVCTLVLEAEFVDDPYLFNELQRSNMAKEASLNSKEASGKAREI